MSRSMRSRSFSRCKRAISGSRSADGSVACVVGAAPPPSAPARLPHAAPRAANSLFAPPFSACRRAMRSNLRRIDHLGVCRSTVAGELPEQVFLYAVPRPPSEAIVDHRRRPVGFGTIGPTAAALQHVYDAADNAAIILPLDTAPSFGKRGSKRCSNQSIAPPSDKRDRALFALMLNTGARVQEILCGCATYAPILLIKFGCTARAAKRDCVQFGRKPHGFCKNSRTVPFIRETATLRYS
jgi:hypothetical protein